jgi:SAM-dependent methyltransferase
MNYQEILLKNYNARTQELDSSDAAKLEWFDFYVEQMYIPYLAPLDKNSAILELGCNKGFLLKSLHKKGFKNLFGVDLSPDDLTIAKAIIPEAQLSYQDAFDFLDTHQNKFDLIILKALIEHIRKDQIMLLLEKINKSLTPNGLVLVDVYNAAWIFALHDRYMDFTHEIGFTQESLRQVMVHSFNDVSVKPTATPLWKMNKKAKIRHLLAKKIFFTLLRWAEPETPAINERVLIAVGRKKEEV